MLLLSRDKILQMLKLSDISFVEETYLNSLIPGFKKINKPNNESTLLVSALISSKSFQETISYLREDTSLPYKTPEEIELSAINDLKIGYSDELESIRGLVNEFDLWDGLTKSVFMILTINCFPQLDLDQFPEIYYHKHNAEISEYLKISEEECFRLSGITFGHIVSKNELIEWIDKNWKEIEKGNREYLPTSPILKDKLKNIALIDEIYQLYRDGVKQNKIIDILSDKYPDRDAVGYDWINNKLNIYKKRVEKYSKKFVSLT